MPRSAGFLLKHGYRHARACGSASDFAASDFAVSDFAVSDFSVSDFAAVGAFESTVGV